MAPITKLALGALFAVQASAHFTLKYPENIGFEDAKESSGPCGGFTADFSKKVPDFHVGGDTIYIVQGHETVTYLYRATLDQTGKSGYQNMVSSNVLVNGLNGNCNPMVPAPSSFVGKKGLIQIIGDAPDGFLYQCAAVNFVDGMGEAKGSGGCTNVTGVSMSYTSDPKLSIDGNSSTPGSSSSSSSPSASSNAAGTIAPTYGAGGTVAWMVLIGLGTAVVRLL